MFDAFQNYSTSSSDSPSDLILTIVFEHVEQDLSTFLRNVPSTGLSEDVVRVSIVTDQILPLIG